MKFYKSILFALFAILSFSAQAQDNKQFPTYLDVGTKINSYPKVDWLQGEAMTSFDPHKIYVIDLWATWCVPCIRAMPHLVQLSDKFKDKNIVFIAQDVMEHDQSKVNTFIQQHPEMKNFLIGYSGDYGSDFDTHWIKAAGINSIPQTFIIQNNTILWQTYPTKVNEQVLQLLIDGKFTIDAAEATQPK